MEAVQDARECRKAGTVLLHRGLLIGARDQFQQWLEMAEASGDTLQTIQALLALTKVASSWGDLDGALHFQQRAVALVAAPVARREEKLRVYLNLMTLYTDMGRLDDARQALEQAEGLEPDRDARLGAAFWLNRSALCSRRQEWEAMREASERALILAEEAGDAAAGNRAVTNRGIAFLELGALDDAEKDLRAMLDLSGDMGSSELAYPYAELGRLHFLRGQYQEALEAGRLALGALLTDVAVLDKEEVARVSRLFGIIFATFGQRNLALKYLNRSAAYYSQLGLRAEWQRSTESIGQVLSGPVKPTRSQLQSEVHQLDFLTGVLDLTDDLESVDPYLRGHSERVANLAGVLGEAAELSAESLGTLSYAARLHDVGMITVDVELMHRPGPLSPAERRRLQMHSTIGEEMLRPYGLPELGLEAIRHHHEHYDGSGSPDGLTGEAIPLLARIVAVADVYDALTSERVYRGAMNHARAVEELRSMAGKELDPVLVERFIELHQI